MFSPISAIVLSSLLLLTNHLPTAHAKTCKTEDIALKSPRVTVGSDGSLTLSGEVKFTSSAVDPAVTVEVTNPLIASVFGQTPSLDVDLCQDATFTDGSDCYSECPCTSYSSLAIVLDETIPANIAQYIPSSFSISANADIYQDGQKLTSCSVGVRSASASVVSMGAVALLLGLGGGAGLLARRRRRRIAMEAEACTSSFVEMADGGRAGDAVMA